uniref:Putative ribonuclease H-like domain-containing protein n=1 Tax=Tanacetum cinerariifolium TaxID=118510 RepID=A0A6L2NMJ0_TANCI|nr:putative ribonuclease H-like domain-containing protein [Tanacetum cinerariifolium]
MLLSKADTAAEETKNGNGLVSVTTYTHGMIKVLHSKTAEEVVARERERKARTTLLMALPEDHLAKFHKMTDAKEMWKAIKSSQLEIHGAGVSYEDANQKFLRSLPSSWSQVALIIRTKPGLDTLSFDDRYNNLRVFELDVKGINASSSNTQNVAFVSTDNTSSTNDVAMISMRIKKFHKRTGRKLQFDTKDPVGFDKTKVECFNCHEMGHFTKDCRAKGNQDSKRKDVGYNGNKARDNDRRAAYQDDSKALLAIDGDDINWSGHVEEDTQNYVMMAYSSSNSGYDNKVQSCSKTCAKSYARLKKLSDEQRDKLGDAGVEITAYTLALKKVEAHLLCHQQNQLAYEQKIRYGSILSYENEVLQSVFMNKECDLKDTHVNDRYAEGMHAVPLPMTGNYMPSRPDVEINYSKFTYGPKQTSVDESNSKPSESVSCESDSCVETPTSMPEPIDNAPKVVCEPKVWTDAPIIEEYASDSDDDSVSNVQENKEKPSFAFTESVKHVKTSRENVKETGTPNHCPKIKKQDRNGHTRKGLGYAFTRKACFVCGSFSHLIRDCDFHDKKMAKQAALTKSKNKDDPHRALKDKEIVDSRCSRHMIGYKSHFADYQEFKGGSVAFGGSNGRITVLLKIPRQHNMYSFNLKSIDPFGDLACLFAKSSIDESNKWNRRLGQVNFKNLNKLVKGNLVRVLPSKIYENDHTCVACQKGKLHKASFTKPQNKTHYELLTGRQPIISYLRPFGCHVTILNTIDKLGKFDGKSNSGFLVEYSLNSKAFRVYNLETKRVEENLHVNFLKNKPTVAGKGHAWMFNLDYLTNSMNYEPVLVENQANKSTNPKEANNSAGTQANDDQDANSKEIDLHEEYYVLPIWSAYSTTELEKLKRQEKEANDGAESLGKEATHDTQNANTNSTNLLNAVSAPVSVVGPSRAFNDGVVTDFNNLETTVNVSPTPTTSIHTIHPKTQILGDPMSAVQTRSKVKKNTKAYALTSQALEDKSWIDAMQEELLQFQIQKEWILVDFPFGKKAIRSKWVYRNKKDEKGVVYRNKARLVAQGHRQDEGIDYDEDKYVAEILKKFDFLSVRTASTPIETQKPLVKDEEAADVDIHLYRSMIGSLMYLTASRPDIMYLKGQPKLGLWYPKVSSFDLEAYSDSDYAGANLDRKSTTRGCQFLGRRFISWQCKKQTIVATSTTEAEYVAVAHCCGQVLWIQNQLLDYGFNLMNTKIYIDNESTICIVKNIVFHSKTKYIGIRHHFIRDAYEKKLIHVLKIHSDDNVADLLMKAFDVSSKELAGPKQTTLGKDKSIHLWMVVCPKLYGYQFTMLSQ